MPPESKSITALELADLLVALSKLERAKILAPQIAAEVRSRIFDRAKGCREAFAQSLMSEPITILGLSNRAHHALMKAQHPNESPFGRPHGITDTDGNLVYSKMETLADLVSCTACDLLSIWALGMGILMEIRRKLFQVARLKLKDEHFTDEQLLEKMP